MLNTPDSNSFKKTVQDMAKDNCIVRHLAGSHAYGMATPTSDVDYRGIFIADPQYILTPYYNVETVDIVGEEDTVYHELGKYCILLSDQNPNIIETVWVDDADIEYRTPEYDYLRQNRDLFLSSKSKFTYCGYAQSQLKRLKGHHKWLDMMDKGKQQIWDLYSKGLMSTQRIRNHFEGEIVDSLNIPYVSSVKFDEVPYDWIEIVSLLRDNNMSEARMMCNIPFTEIEFINKVSDSVHNVLSDRDNYVAVKSKTSPNLFNIYHIPGHGYKLFDGRGKLVTNYVLSTQSTSPVFTLELNTGLKNQMAEKWNNYHTWRSNRNATRSAMESKFGYDTKHASHLIRLLKTGVEILRDRTVHVKRPDAKELLDIRNGSLTLDELLEYSDSLETECNKLYETTTLQHSINVSAVATVLMNIRLGKF